MGETMITIKTQLIDNSYEPAKVYEVSSEFYGDLEQFVKTDNRVIPYIVTALANNTDSLIKNLNKVIYDDTK
jgi:hypothetical protein